MEKEEPTVGLELRGAPPGGGPTLPKPGDQEFTWQLSSGSVKRKVMTQIRKN